jgi:sulfide:quinone oxidoreductase
MSWRARTGDARDTQNRNGHERQAGEYCGAMVRKRPLVDERVHKPDAKALEVVIAGGGVAALETALALHKLAGNRVKLTLLAPTADFVYRPMAVLEPFVHKHPRQLPLAKVAAEFNATLVQGSVAAVDCQRRMLRTDAQRELAYDALVIAVGARTSEVLPDAVAIDVSRMDESLHSLIEEIDSSSLRSLAFVAPKPTWPLPVYELALLVQEHAREKNVDLDVTIITSEQRPLAAFGENVSAGVAAILADAHIQTIVGARVESSSGELIVHPGEQQLRFDRVVALPRLAGPAITGLPADADGFLPITSHCEVTGTERVYAAGDATDFPVKYGAIAAQQADAAAASIAAMAGAAAEPTPFDGVVHGALVSGREYRCLYFTARIEGGLAQDSRTSDTPTWSPEAKIAARHLGPYLDKLWGGQGLRWLAGQLSWEAAAMARLSK